MNTQKRGLIAFLILLIGLALIPTASALNIFYTTQSSNATLEVSGYLQANDAGLAGYWKCDENFNDSGGMNNHGTQSGGVTITRGVKGRACGFGGDAE